MSASTVSFVGWLVFRNPELLPLLRDHLADMDGEVLAHPFMSDVERWLEVEYARARVGPSPVILRVLATIEEGLAAKDAEIEELIAVSFVEHIPQPGEPLAAIQDLLGPATARLIQRNS